MYKATYMFYFAPNLATNHIAEFPRNAFVVLGGAWWECRNLHLIAQRLAKICRRWPLFDNFERNFEKLQSVANIYNE